MENNLDSRMKRWLSKNRHISSDIACNMQDISDYIKSNSEGNDVEAFIKFMAIHGYTLQKSKAKYYFLDLEDTLNKFKEDK